MFKTKSMQLKKYQSAWLAALLACCSVFSYAKEHPEAKQVALVIGNAKYENSPLVNPTNDSIDVATKLKNYGFEVVYRENIKMRQIGSMLREFKQKLSPGATALIFYAGHGLQVRGENYFPSIDADIQSEEDIQNQSIGLKQLMDILEESKTRTNIVLLDACRNNPFERRTRSLTRGLASTSAPSGTMIAYSTRPGSVAEDGSGRNGLYTEQLLQLMDTKKPIEQVLKQLVSKVKTVSKGRQEPWSEGSLEGDFCFGGCSDANDEKQKLVADIALWESIIGSSSISDYEKYIKEYPNGTFSSLAKKTIENLKKLSNRTAVTSSENNSGTLELVKQADELKKIELLRIEKEAIEKEKTLNLAQEKLLQEAANRAKLEAELEKVKQESAALRQSASNQNLNQPPKKLFVSPSL